MEHILVNGVPFVACDLTGVINESDILLETEKRQKFVQVHGHPELHITGCAVSRLSMIHKFPELPEPEYKSYFVELNKDYKEWLAEYEKNLDLPEDERVFKPLPDRAWVKVYRWISPDIDSTTSGQVQKLAIKMPFLGESVEECWGELQINVKRTVVRSGRNVDLELVKFGRYKSFDSQVSEWVPETKPIEPKIKKDDEGNQKLPPKSHYYVSLRLYHQNYLPEIPGDWHFEPAYAVIACKDFYRIDAIWQDEEIVITATMLDGDATEIPKFLRR